MSLQFDEFFGKILILVRFEIFIWTFHPVFCSRHYDCRCSRFERFCHTYTPNGSKGNFSLSRSGSTKLTYGFQFAPFLNGMAVIFAVPRIATALRWMRTNRSLLTLSQQITTPPRQLWLNQEWSKLSFIFLALNSFIRFFNLMTNLTFWAKAFPGFTTTIGRWSE